MIKLKKVTISLLMAVGLLGATPLTASAASVYNTEFGTLNYSLTRSGSTVTAKTSVQRQQIS